MLDYNLYKPGRWVRIRLYKILLLLLSSLLVLFITVRNKSTFFSFWFKSQNTLDSVNSSAKHHDYK